MDIEKFLSTVDMFQYIDDEDRKLLADQSRLVSHQDGDLITRQGEQPTSLWVICQGQVEVILEKDGEKKLIATLNAGEIFGELSIFQPNLLTADVISRGDSSTVQIPGDLFKDVIYGSSVSIGMPGESISKQLSQLKG